MLDSFRKIREFIAGMDYAAFLEDEKTQSAVIMQLEVTGQLAKKTPERTRAEIDVPWKEMAGMRDWVAHDYFSLEHEQVWHTATEAVPLAESKIKKYLEGQGGVTNVVET